MGACSPGANAGTQNGRRSGRNCWACSRSPSATRFPASICSDWPKGRRHPQSVAVKRHREEANKCFCLKNASGVTREPRHRPFLWRGASVCVLGLQTADASAALWSRRPLRRQRATEFPLTDPAAKPLLHGSLQGGFRPIPGQDALQPSARPHNQDQSGEKTIAAQLLLGFPENGVCHSSSLVIRC